MLTDINDIQLWNTNRILDKKDDVELDDDDELDEEKEISKERTPDLDDDVFRDDEAAVISECF